MRPSTPQSSSHPHLLGPLFQSHATARRMSGHGKQVQSKAAIHPNLMSMKRVITFREGGQQEEEEGEEAAETGDQRDQWRGQMWDSLTHALWGENVTEVWIRAWAHGFHVLVMYVSRACMCVCLGVGRVKPDSLVFTKPPHSFTPVKCDAITHYFLMFTNCFQDVLQKQENDENRYFRFAARLVLKIKKRKKKYYFE